MININIRQHRIGEENTHCKKLDMEKSTVVSNCDHLNGMKCTFCIRQNNIMALFLQKEKEKNNKKLSITT